MASEYDSFKDYLTIVNSYLRSYSFFIFKKKKSKVNSIDLFFSWRNILKIRQKNDEIFIKNIFNNNVKSVFCFSVLEYISNISLLNCYEDLNIKFFLYYVKFYVVNKILVANLLFYFTKIFTFMFFSKLKADVTNMP